MNRHLLQACEGVDASVFSGDVLYDDEARGELKKYVARWQRAIDEHEAPEQAEAQAKSEPALTDAQLDALMPEPALFSHQTLAWKGKGHERSAPVPSGVHLGVSERGICEQAHIAGETDETIFEWLSREQVRASMRAAIAATQGGGTKA